MNRNYLLRSFIAMLLIFLMFLQQPLNAQYTSLFMKGFETLALAKGKAELTKVLGETFHVGSPLLLDQRTAFEPTAEPTDFRCQQLTVSSSEDLARPLPPGDYCVTVIAFCTRASIHAPGAGLPYKMALVQGRASRAISSLIVNGIQQEISPKEINLIAWRIQAGIPMSRMPDNEKALCLKLIPPSLIKEIEGNYIQKAEAVYNTLKNLPHFPTLADFGGPGKLFALVLHERAALADQTITAENAPDHVYQPQADGLPRVLPAQPGTSPSPWAEVRPGVIARLTVQQGNMGDNLFEFRVQSTPQSARLGSSDARLVNAVFSPQLAVTTGRSATSLGSILGDTGILGGELALAEPLLIGFSIGLAAQALIIVARRGGGKKATAPPVATPTKTPANTVTQSQTCTNAERDELQADVDDQCKTLPRACSSSMFSCLVLKRNWYRNERCARAREAINKRCFDGGDPGHQQAAEEARQAEDNCRSLYRLRCN